MNSTETKRLLETLHACDDARAWVGRHTLQWAWEHCERGDWMEWLVGKLDIRMTDQARAEYERVMAQARAEYERVRAQARARAEYNRVTVQALAEYDRVRAPAWAEYERAMAQAFRAAIPWETVREAARQKLDTSSDY